MIIIISRVLYLCKKYLFNLFQSNIMSKYTSLTQLIQSLTKSERKKIAALIRGNGIKPDNDYIVLYKIIMKEPTIDQDEAKKTFSQKKPTSTFNTAVNYLLDIILSLLTQLRSEQDSYYKLFHMLMNAKILYEKSIYSECFQLISKIQSEAEKFENFSLLLVAQQLELEYMLTLDFLDLSEQELLNKQLKINETMKKIRKINEHSFLFELLRHRTLHKGNVRSNKQKQELNDLVISEMSIVSSSGVENFEIQKNHLLFQANYLISVGDYKSALISFYELNSFFEKNMHLLSNPPIYYLNTIEGILDNLRTIKKYNEMNYFIHKLENLQNSSIYFRMQVKFIAFFYRTVPFIDGARYTIAKEMLNDIKCELFSNINLLTTSRKFQLLLNVSIIYLGCNELSIARKYIIQITSEKDYISKPLLRTARLINLIIMYELHEFDFIDYEIRSLKREIKNSENAYQIEQILIKVLNYLINNYPKKVDKKVCEKIELSLNSLYDNRFELQVLRIFDFGAWIKSKICNQPLSQVFRREILSKE